MIIQKDKETENKIKKNKTVLKKGKDRQIKETNTNSRNKN